MKAVKITPFARKVYQLVRKIPKSKVSTYKEIAKALKTKVYRAVGQALKNNPNPPYIPCHRVVRNDGTIGGFMGKTKGRAISRKINLLKQEGIEFKENKIKNFNKLLCKF